MKALSIAAILVASHALSCSAFAQDSKADAANASKLAASGAMGPSDRAATRVKRKAAAASALKAGAVPAGEGSVDMPPPRITTPNDEKAAARAKRKTEASSALKSGNVPKGEAALDKPQPKVTTSAEERAAARAKRKAEAGAALKADDVPKGEGTK